MTPGGGEGEANSWGILQVYTFYVSVKGGGGLSAGNNVVCTPHGATASHSPPDGKTDLGQVENKRMIRIYLH